MKTKKMMYRSVGISLSLIMCLGFILCVHQPVAVAQEQPHVSAQAAILMDVESGRVLFEKNSRESLRIASLTKIMTALVAIEHGDLEETVVTSKNAFGVEGSSIFLKLGEKLTLEEMLYGLMLRSGNDAAVAIAEHIGGSIEGFTFLMNQKAEELGMTDSIFNNPHGLDDHPEHYASAHDLALLSSYALKNDTFATIVSTKRKTAPLEGEKWDRVWHNKNRMLTKYPYADGVKTGYTKLAHRTLVSSATKDGHRLVVVTLNAPDDWNDHIHLFEYGYEQYQLVRMDEQGKVLRDERLIRDQGEFQLMNHFAYPLTENEEIDRKIVIDPVLQGEPGDKVPYPAGFVYYHLDQQEIGKVPVQFVLYDQEPSLFQRLQHIFSMLWGDVDG